MFKKKFEMLQFYMITGLIGAIIVAFSIYGFRKETIKKNKLINLELKSDIGTVQDSISESKEQLEKNQNSIQKRIDSLSYKNLESQKDIKDIKKKVSKITKYPKLEIVFKYPHNIAYSIVNKSAVMAESVLVSSGICDLDDPNRNYVPIPVPKLEYVNGNSSKGPFQYFDQYIEPNHKKYFGYIIIECKGCNKDFRYALYVDYENPINSFYAKRTLTVKEMSDIPIEQEKITSYIEKLIPSKNRIVIK